MAPNQLSNSNLAEIPQEPDVITTMDSPVEQQLTPLQQFYRDQNIFITGGTGFLGKILIEKLLRSCPDISCIYLLIRSKKGKNLQSRVEELFDDFIFSRLKKEQPKFRHKIQEVSGDCSLPNLGLSDNDIKMLQSQVTIVFHVAATVRFDEKLKLATAINVTAPRDLLSIAKGMGQLKSFVHVSTAYAYCPQDQIDEKFYTPPMDSAKLITLTDAVPDTLLEKITPSILGSWPNTYAFTKAVAEDVIRQHGVDLPVGVFRPAIVISTYKEPVEAWIDNMYGPIGVVAAASNGVMRTLYCDPEVNANVVPVDFCVNSLIASAWDIAKRHEEAVKQSKSKSSDDIPIYNYVSQVENPINYDRYMSSTAKYGIEYPSVKALYYYQLTLNKNLFVHYIYMIFLHYLPALLFDSYYIMTGRRPRILGLFKKIHRFMTVISYFCTRNWIFTNDNTQKLWKILPDEDKQIFMFDIKQLDWDDYFKSHLKGIRLYILKDPMTTIDQARKKWQRLYIIHLCIKYVSLFLFVQCCWMVLQYVYNNYLV